jgi:hypothetical protein
MQIIPRGTKKARGLFFRKDLTLAELMVVIAFIGILAAMLLPAFAKARERARRASCLSNLKELSTILSLYSEPIMAFNSSYKYPPVQDIHNTFIFEPDALIEDDILDEPRILICPGDPDFSCGYF